MPKFNKTASAIEATVQFLKKSSSMNTAERAEMLRTKYGNFHQKGRLDHNAVHEMLDDLGFDFGDDAGYVAGIMRIYGTATEDEDGDGKIDAHDLRIDKKSFARLYVGMELDEAVLDDLTVLPDETAILHWHLLSFIGVPYKKEWVGGMTVSPSSRCSLASPCRPSRCPAAVTPRQRRPLLVPTRSRSRRARWAA